MSVVVGVEELAVGDVVCGQHSYGKVVGIHGKCVSMNCIDGTIHNEVVDFIHKIV